MPYGWSQPFEDLCWKQWQEQIVLILVTNANEYWIVSVRNVYSKGLSTQFVIESSPRQYCNIQCKFVLDTLNNLYSKKIQVGKRQTKNVIIITIITLNIRSWRISRLVFGFFSAKLFVWLDVEVDISIELLCGGGRNAFSAINISINFLIFLCNYYAILYHCLWEVHHWQPYLFLRFVSLRIVCR